MKRRSISTKLFLVTSLFIIGLLSVMMVLHTTFFESYYQWTKTEELKNNLEKLKGMYKASQYRSNGNIEAELLKFANQSGGMIAFITRNANGTFQMKVVSPKDGFSQTDKAGNIITVIPDKVENTLLYKQIYYLMDGWVKKPENFNAFLQNEKTISVVGDPKTPLAGHIYSMTPVPLGNGDQLQAVMLSVASLQPVGEATAIVKDFYIYSFILAILLILLLTFIFTRMISKPLVRLNDTASQMAQLDFSVRYAATSNDEIGNLGKTLNFLSQNLNDTLLQLNTANEQLKQDIEKDKQLEKLRREFVAGVSHELKTPISLIYGYAEGLRDGVAQGKRKEEYLDVILQETEHMGKLVTDMLDLAQLESGKFAWTSAPFEIGSLIRATVDKLSVQIAAHGIQCELLWPPQESIIVEGDKSRIEQVLKNLLSNAIRHTPRNGRIKIRLDRHDLKDAGSLDEQGYVLVRLFNEGVAIPEEAIAHIWDTFYKVDSSRNRELGGTGIGLSIVKSILSIQGNDFGVSNKSGGVEFYFTLPLHR
jgi:two-component system sensor histidine kinase VanS